MRLIYASVWFLVFVAGCRDIAPAKTDSPSTKVEGKVMSEPKSAKTISVKGFDPEGEPEIRVLADGTISIVFNFMPPSWDEENKRCADFDRQLAKALGTQVHWEDREVFLIDRPANDSVEKAQAFLESYRKNLK